MENESKLVLSNVTESVSKLGGSKMKFKQMIGKATKTIGKNSPLILTGLGVIGVGATAFFTYKSRTRVEEIIEELEEDRENDIPVNRFEVAKDLTGALALPVLLGVGSACALILSYRIQNNRIVTLAGALAATTAEQTYFRAKYKKEHGQEAYDRFVTPTEEQEITRTDEDGKEVTTIEEIKKDVPGIYGEWFDQSTEYASDDHDYNMAYINSVNEKLSLVLFQKGYLQLNEVREALGFQRTRAGALMGWSSADTFEISTTVTKVTDPETGLFSPQIFVKWHEAKYIYQDIDYSPVVYGL